MELKNKKVLVLGKGITGISTASFLKKKEAIVTLADEKDDGPFINIDPMEFDLVVHSPGISRQHPFLEACDLAGVKVTNEIEIASLFCNKPIIGVTGTNGKTTIVNILHEIFNGCGKTSALVGNVGRPFIDLVVEPYDLYVLELSSYQLETVEKFRPRVAIISNLTPDHLERHKTMENYLKIKTRIYKNMDFSDYVLLNYDDPYLRKLKPQNSNILYFSMNDKVQGIYVRDGKVVLNIDGEIELFSINDLKIIGGHNVENAMASVLACYLMKLPVDCIVEKMRNFKGVEHRLEFVREIDGIKYYNDSKSTNPEAAIIAVKAFAGKPMKLILGGSEKAVSYQELAETIRDNNVFTIIQGATRYEIAQALENVGVKDYALVEDLRQALNIAVDKAASGDVVVLSPACASFDQFDNFEHRGEIFKEYVWEI